MRGWRDLLPLGHTIAGDSNSKATMIVFADLECPACRAFHARVRKTIDTHPRDLRVVYVDFPLPYHRFGLPAARAMECLSHRGNVRSWIDVVYEKQDSLGLKSWSSFAHDAGFADTTGIDACANNPASIASIDSSIAFGQRARIHGTPTVVLNGWVFSSVPTTEQMDSAMAHPR
jgi:protein-disulfide isomerase